MPCNQIVKHTPTHWHPLIYLPAHLLWRLWDLLQWRADLVETTIRTCACACGTVPDHRQPIEILSANGSESQLCKVNDAKRCSPQVSLLVVRLPILEERERECPRSIYILRFPRRGELSWQGKSVTGQDRSGTLGLYSFYSHGWCRVSLWVLIDM